ncbi:nicotinamide mononucleotide transporter [Alistipes putredinis]|uniref:nicotinamide mononucleotide transporter n=1 Tax=Alistipes putredinis TaxID=28117 RepID=UPI00210B3EDE|nr:nicotinamide mononucleotide transporter [Alistipes putredinis]MCQ5078206.1 nicotinamide mononucleotide transporter family protein [Alistipes putredinis]
MEQWFVCFVVYLVTVGLYFYKEIALTALLYTIYLTMSLAVYFRWRLMMRRQLRG